MVKIRRSVRSARENTGAAGRRRIFLSVAALDGIAVCQLMMPARSQAAAAQLFGMQTGIRDGPRHLCSYDSSRG